MNNEIQTLLKELEKHGVNGIDLASKLRLSYAAVRAWKVGERTPKYPTIEKVKQILNGYRSKK